MSAMKDMFGVREISCIKRFNEGRSSDSTVSRI